MKHTVTYLDDSTIVCFSNEIVIIDSNLKNWVVSIVKWSSQLFFKHKDSNSEIIVYKSGQQLWYQHGKYHRDDGPAIVRVDGVKFWYKNGKQIKKKPDLSVAFLLPAI